MKKLTLFFTVLVLILVLPFSALAEETEVSVKEHNLSLTLPSGFTLLDSSNAEENENLVKNFGYTVSSFKGYLEQNSIILFAAAEDNTQLSIKCWETDFSKEVTDLSLLDEDALKSVAKQIIIIPGASYKSATVGGMKLFEVKKADNDSGGDFYSVQYVTIRNGKIYSVNIAFPGKESEESKAAAWEIAKSLKIADKTTTSPWDVTSVFEMVLIWVIIIAAAVTVVIILVSFVVDCKKRKAEKSAGTEIIFRRKK